MTKNLYYRNHFRRFNIIKELVLNFFLAYSSYPRLLLEVFLRRNLGERYFTLASVITIVVVLMVFPVALMYSPGIFYKHYEHFETSAWARIGHVTANNILLYLFLAAFVAASLRRHREIQRLPSVFDFGRFSLSTGSIHPFFLNLEIGGKPADVRRIETLLEPLPFFVGGVLLWLLTNQSLGPVLIVISLIYSLGYVASYNDGDHFVMDKIDEMICNEELVHAFVDGQEVDQTRGFRFYGRRPADPELRRQLAEAFIEHDDDDAVEAK